MQVEFNRDSGLALLLEYNKSDSLIKHAYAVEATMRHFAGIYGGDEEEWGIVGLLHDLDYETYPDQHCEMTEKILREHNWPEHIIRAVLSHGYGICTDVEPQTDMEKVLYAIDELTGLITAAVLVRPSKNIAELKLKSVKKKWKDARFAAGANREVITAGADRLGMDLDELINNTIEGMRKAAGALGLAGE